MTTNKCANCARMIMALYVCVCVRVCVRYEDSFDYLCFNSNSQSSLLPLPAVAMAQSHSLRRLASIKIAISSRPKARSLGLPPQEGKLVDVEIERVG